MTTKYTEKLYSAQEQKSLRSALRQTFITDLGLSGHKFVELAVNEVLDTVDAYQVSGERLRKGQMVWTAVSRDGKGARGRPLAEVPMESVVLTVVGEEDTRALKRGAGVRAVRDQKIQRLCHEAYEQGAVLNLTDLGEILDLHRTTVSSRIAAIEQDSESLLPTRGTVHDLGRKVSHKAEIVRKVVVEKRAPPDVARELNHRLESVDRYLNDFERVQALEATHAAPEIAFITGMSLSLAEEYVDLIDALGASAGDES